MRPKEWQGELDTEGVFIKGTSEVQHRQGYEICKYTTGSSFQVICHYVSNDC